MESARRLFEIFALAVLLAVSSVGCSNVSIPTSIGAQSASVEFHSDYEQARKLARSSGKPLLVVIRTAWCPFSHELLHETFADRDVIRACDRFVCVALDADKQPDLCRLLSATTAYPNVHFVTDNDVEFANFHGSRTPKELLAEIQDAISASARMPLPLRVFR